MKLNLPSSTTLNRVANLLGEARQLGFSGWSLRVRTVAFTHQDKWYHFATHASVETGAFQAERASRPRENVALIDRSIPIGSPQNAGDLSSYLTHWQAIVGSEPRVTFQNTVQLNRNSSDYRKAMWPTWRSQLSAAAPQISWPLPDGPFFDPKARIFGETVGKLAVQFLEDTRFGNHHSAPNEYLLRIPDGRVRISGLDVVENELQIQVENSFKLKLYCSVIASSFGGNVFHKVLDFVDNEASIALPFTVANLELWVILEDGYALDHYEETPQRSTWGIEASLFNAPRKAQQHAIGKALAEGENDSVEYKPYVVLKPGIDKAMEILRAVSAFANTGGGNIYFGVSDWGEPIGIDKGLAHDYGKDGDLPNRQKAYERDLQKLINEGTSPTLPIEYHWHDLAHVAILQVKIPLSSKSVVLLVSGDSYQRAGATNRKGRAEVQVGTNGLPFPIPYP